MSKTLKIYTIEDPKQKIFLRKVSKNVTNEEIKTDKFQKFLDDLIYTAENVLTDDGYSAAGLSAIQVGVDKKVFCILKEDSSEFEIMINPEFKVIKNEKSVDIEGCLSVPHKEGSVSRFKKIKVKYLDRNGKVQKGIFSGQEAREIQHEYDHTEGILFIDKLED